MPADIYMKIVRDREAFMRTSPCQRCGKTSGENVPMAICKICDRYGGILEAAMMGEGMKSSCGDPEAFLTERDGLRQQGGKYTEPGNPIIYCDNGYHDD